MHSVRSKKYQELKQSFSELVKSIVTTVDPSLSDETFTAESFENLQADNPKLSVPEILSTYLTDVGVRSFVEAKDLGNRVEAFLNMEHGLIMNFIQLAEAELQREVKDSQNPAKKKQTILPAEFFVDFISELLKAFDKASLELLLQKVDILIKYSPKFGSLAYALTTLWGGATTVINEKNKTLSQEDKAGDPVLVEDAEVLEEKAAAAAEAATRYSYISRLIDRPAQPIEIVTLGLDSSEAGLFKLHPDSAHIPGALISLLNDIITASSLEEMVVAIANLNDRVSAFKNNKTSEEVKAIEVYLKGLNFSDLWSLKEETKEGEDGPRFFTHKDFLYMLKMIQQGTFNLTTSVSLEPVQSAQAAKIQDGIDLVNSLLAIPSIPFQYDYSSAQVAVVERFITTKLLQVDKISQKINNEIYELSEKGKKLRNKGFSKEGLAVIRLANQYQKLSNQCFAGKKDSTEVVEEMKRGEETIKGLNLASSTTSSILKTVKNIVQIFLVFPAVISTITSKIITGNWLSWMYTGTHQQVEKTIHKMEAINIKAKL